MAIDYSSIFATNTSSLASPAADAPSISTSNSSRSSSSAPSISTSQSSLSSSSALVYIVGRVAGTQHGEGTYLIHETHLNIASACRATAGAISADTTETTLIEPLNFVIFVSVLDYAACGHHRGLSPETRRKICDFATIEDSCQAAFETDATRAVFEYREMNETILNIWESNTGIVEFSHHSLWYGYTKVWLPILLTEDEFNKDGRKKYDVALFVDTDIVWNKPPSFLFADIDRFNSEQAIGALRTPGDGVCDPVNRINSGVMLFNLKKLAKLDWRIVVRNVVKANRGGLDVYESIPDTYNQSDFCQRGCRGPRIRPRCLTVPSQRPNKGNECAKSRSCWNAFWSDQEFLSHLISPPHHPELFYPMTGYKGHLLGNLLNNYDEFVRTNKPDNIQNDTLFHIQSLMDLVHPNVTVENLDSIFPSQTFDSIQWFRQNIDSTPRPVPSSLPPLT